jgi:hypothetical protein
MAADGEGCANPTAICFFIGNCCAVVSAEAARSLLLKIAERRSSGRLFRIVSDHHKQTQRVLLIDTPFDTPQARTPVQQRHYIVKPWHSLLQFSKHLLAKLHDIPIHKSRLSWR